MSKLKLSSFQQKHRSFSLSIIIGVSLILLLNYPNLFTNSSIQKQDALKEAPLTPPTHTVDAEKILKDNPQVAECLDKKDGKEEECVNNFLKIYSEQKGGRPALDLIEAASQKYPELLAWSHPFAHTIGQHSLIFYEQFKNIPLESKIGRALVECDGFGAFGCYHGVVEIGLTKLPMAERSKVMRKACLEDPLITQKAYFVNQCSHWFGHAVAIFTNNTLLEALAMCDGLDSKWHADIVQLCLSGVFHAGLAPGGELIEDKTVNIKNVFREDDPYYPCLDIPEKYRSHCYSHAYGRTRNSDMAVQLQICNNIPESNSEKKKLYSGVCYDSVGNSVIEKSNFDPQTVVDNCRKYSNPDLRQYCYGGAARYWVLRNPLLENTKPLEVCSKAEKDAKPVCYARAGFGNYENFYSQETLKKFCDMGEEPYRQYCMSRSAPQDFTRLYVDSTNK